MGPSKEVTLGAGKVVFSCGSTGRHSWSSDRGVNIPSVVKVHLENKKIKKTAGLLHLNTDNHEHLLRTSSCPRGHGGAVARPAWSVRR